MITVVSFLLLLEDTAVSVALPTIRRDLGGGLTGLEWVVNAYTLALAATLWPAVHAPAKRFVSGLSDALRINVRIALLAAVVAAATITAAIRRGQAPPTDASLAATAAEPVPAAPSTVFGVALRAPDQAPAG